MNASKLRLYHRLQVAAHTLQKAADRVVSAAAQLTTAQAAVLTIVAAGDGITQRDVAIALHLNESAVTAMVLRLVKLRLLRRRRSQHDPRAWHLSPSKRGRTALAASRAAFASINERIESQLSQREIVQLVEYLNRLTLTFTERSQDQTSVRAPRG
jgi:MarR family transcriptional regulator, organic hydroperoxide resistance regulator